MVYPTDWHDFAEGQRVMTREGYEGKVDEVLDGPGPGNEHYRVTLNDGKGGGTYGANELSPLSTTATKTADLHADYPELSELVSAKPPPEANISAEAYVSGLLNGEDTLYSAVLALHKQATDGGDHSNSAMVAIPMPQDVAHAAAVEGGLDPSEMHVTLAYLPSPSPEQLQATHQVVSDVAAQHPALSGSVGGAGQFPGGEDGVPHFAPVDIPGLHELRNAVVTGLAGAGVEYATDHDFTPHMTRTYLPEGQEGPEPLAPHDVQIPSLVVAEGDDWTHYPLSSTGVDPGADSADDSGQDPSETVEAAKQAGFWSDFITGRPGPAVNYDWCKFRHNQLCVFPSTLDVDATLDDGQARWVPKVRGRCGRDWQQQANCPVGEASPNAHQMGVASLLGDKEPTE